MRSGEVGKRFLDETHPVDRSKITAITALVERMQGDVHLYVHGYHTCSVERANSERTAYTSKRVELYRNWRGKCKLVQLLHNHGATATASWVREHLGWQVTEDVRDHWRKIDRDKAKHRQIKSDPSYNRRKRQLEEERKARSAEATAATKEKRKEKEKKKKKAAAHRYHVKKQLLYPGVDGAAAATGTAEIAEENRSSLRGRKRKADKENTAGEENRCVQPAVTRWRMGEETASEELVVLVRVD